MRMTALRGPGQVNFPLAVFCSQDRCQMCDKTAANRDVVIREPQATASYMVDATQQAKLKRYVGSRRKCEEGLERGNVCSTVERADLR